MPDFRKNDFNEEEAAGTGMTVRHRSRRKIVPNGLPDVQLLKSQAAEARVLKGEAMRIFSDSSADVVDVVFVETRPLEKRGGSNASQRRGAGGENEMQSPGPCHERRAKPVLGAEEARKVAGPPIAGERSGSDDDGDTFDI